MGSQKSENFMQFQNIYATQGRVPCAIFMKFKGFVGSFMLNQLLKFGEFS